MDEGLVRRVGAGAWRTRILRAATVAEHAGNALGGLPRRPRGLSWGQVVKAAGLCGQAAELLRQAEAVLLPMGRRRP